MDIASAIMYGRHLEYRISQSLRNLTHSHHTTRATGDESVNLEPPPKHTSGGGFYNKHTCREVSPGLDAPRVAGSFANSPSKVRWVRETSSHSRCVQSRTHRTCKYVFLSHALSVKVLNNLRILVYISCHLVMNIIAANILRKQTNLGFN